MAGQAFLLLILLETPNTDFFEARFIMDVSICFRDKIRDNYDDFYKAFQKYDTKKKGYLSVNEVQQVLVDFNLFLDDEQFFTLLDR